MRRVMIMATTKRGTGGPTIHPLRGFVFVVAAALALQVRRYKLRSTVGKYTALVER